MAALWCFSLSFFQFTSETVRMKWVFRLWYTRSASLTFLTLPATARPPDFNGFFVQKITECLFVEDLPQ